MHIYISLTHAHMCIHIHVCKCLCAFLHMCIYVSSYVYSRVYSYTYLHIHMQIHTCTYTLHIHVYMCIHTHTHSCTHSMLILHGGASFDICHRHEWLTAKALYLILFSFLCRVPNLTFATGMTGWRRRRWCSVRTWAATRLPPSTGIFVYMCMHTHINVR